MALNISPQSQTKRLTYASAISDGSAMELNYVFSDDDIKKAGLKKKVRQELSQTISTLKKGVEYSKIGLSRCARRHDIKPSKKRYSECEVDEDSIKPLNRQPRSRNAELARLNRQKKKQYISSLENNNTNLQKQNDENLKKIGLQEEVISRLQYEILYLKGLLANSKEISQILNSLEKSTGLPVSSSIQTLIAEGSDQESSAGHKYLSDNFIEPKKQFVQCSNVRTVTSGSNFPILIEDVNLSSSCDKINNTEIEFKSLIKPGADLGSSMENDCHFDSHFLNESEYEFKFSEFDNVLISLPDHECSHDQFKLKDKESNKSRYFEENNALETDAGLCIHINKKKISLEFCSICNGRVQQQK